MLRTEHVEKTSDRTFLNIHLLAHLFSSISLNKTWNDGSLRPGGQALPILPQNIPDGKTREAAQAYLFTCFFDA